MQLQHCCNILQCIAFVQSYLISLQFCNCNAITIFCCNLFNKNCNSAIFVKWRSGTASGGDKMKNHYGIYFNKKLVYNISDRDLSCMEYALITYLKPRLNREGVIRKFRF